MFDIEDLYTVEAHSKGAEMQVDGPDDKPLELYITFIGLDSDKWDEINRKHKQKRLAAIRAEDFKLENKIKAEMMAEAVISWRGFERKGKAVKMTKKSVVELFINAPYLWTQANLFISDRANFMKG